MTTFLKNRDMKFSFHLLLTCIALTACGESGKTTADYRIVPRPGEIAPGDGGDFELDARTRIVCTGDGDGMRANAEFLAGYVESVVGSAPEITGPDGLCDDGRAVILRADAPGKGGEAYEIEVSENRITVSGESDAGVFYGIQTLRKAMGAAKAAKVLFPAVRIADEPYLGYRGVMLDVGRTFYPVEEVKRIIDLAALHNLNVFHWHLTDDQGWRIEIDAYPRLTETGAFRRDTTLAGEPGTFGGYYTKRQIRDIVEYAARRYIEVVPEIDMPGHMTAALASYPELGCTGGPYVITSQPGVRRDILCAGNPAVFDFVEKVLEEVIGLFPSEYIHIGGDEASKQGWRTCPKCAARMRKEGLKDVDELQSYMIRRIETFLNAKGRRLLGWDEILEGGLAPDATVMSWRGTEGGIAAAAAGHHAVMTPSNYCYLDFCQDDPTTEPVAAAAFLTLEQAYSYDPAPDSLGAQVVPMILGVQGNLWCEHVPTAEHAEHMMWPRLLAVAEVGWSAPERKDYDDFYARALDAVAWLQERGYHPFDQKNAVGPRPESLEPLRCLSTGKTVIYHTPYSPKYAAAGDGSLTDGLRGGWNYGDRRWLGWLDTDVDLVVDLGERQPVRRIAADFMQGFYADIWMPRAVEFSVSDDNEHFTPLATVGNDIPVEFKQDCYREFGWTGQTEARYVRLKARHNGRPGGWIFTDEIIVE